MAAGPLESMAAEVCRRFAPTAEPAGLPVSRTAVGDFAVKVAAGRVHVRDSTGVRVAWFDLPRPDATPGVPLRPVMVLDEERRRDVVAAIEGVLARGHPEVAEMVGASADEDARPYMPVQMGYLTGREVWYVSVGDNSVGVAPVRLGLYDHRDKSLMVPAEGLVDLLVNTVRRTGFEVDSWYLVTEQAFMDIGWWGELSFAPDTWLADCGKDQPAVPASGGTHLHDDILGSLPVPVAELLRLGRGQHQQTVIETPRDTGVWTPERCRVLVEALGEFVVPQSAAAIWRRWHAVSPWHAHLLTTDELSRVEPEWWDALPTYAVTREHVLGTGFVPPANWDPSPYAVDLRAMDEDELDRTGHRGVLELFEGWNRPDGLHLLGFAKSDSAAAALVVTAVLRDFGFPDACVTLTCRLCRCSYSVGALGWWQVEELGAVDYCPGCYADSDGTVDEFAYDDVSNGQQVVEFGLTTSLAQVQATTGVLPTHRNLRQVFAMEMPSTLRDRLMLLRMATPPLSPFSVAMGERRPRPLTDWLQLAGVIDGTRSGRGVSSTAADGHSVRSILEREIDDWMHAHGIPHELEPDYPYDPELNPNGSRADWLLPGGVFVEAAGLLTDERYDQKMQRKRLLAERHGLHLVVLMPADLDDLDRHLGVFRKAH